MPSQHNPFHAHTPLGTPITEMSFDCLAAHLVEARSRYFAVDVDGWREVTRFTYDVLLEVGKNVKVARVRPVEGAFQ